MSELIDRILDEFKDINYAYNDATKLDTLSRMLDELVEQTASPRWVRCEEPPKKMGCYLVIGYERYWFYDIAEYYPEGIWVMSGDYDSKDTALLRYWMPLPEPPKEDA